MPVLIVADTIGIGVCGCGMIASVFIRCGGGILAAACFWLINQERFFVVLEGAIDMVLIIGGAHENGCELVF